MSNLRNRLLLIGAMILASFWALFPRDVVERRVNPADSSVSYDTVSRFPLKRGLDLAGGMYVALEIDQERQRVANESEALDRALTVLRKRIDPMGVTEADIRKAGSNRITVELPGVDDERRALEMVAKVAQLEFQITDESGALQKALPRLNDIVRREGAVVGTTARSGDSARPANPLSGIFAADSGARADTGQGADTNDLFGATGEGPLSDILMPGEIPGEFFVLLSDVPKAERYLSLPAVRQALPPGQDVLWGSDTIPLGAQLARGLYVVGSRAILTGESLIDATPQQAPEGIVVAFTLDNAGGRRFRSETSRHIGDYMAIVLDDRVMGRPPVIQSAIGTRGQITLGGNRLQEATDLALVLRAGALPVPLRVIEIRKIGPSLGQDAIRQGINAGVLSVALVVLIMVVYYRFSGFLAVLGLVFYTLSTLAILAGFDATLTLPGIAGFVLSIGMAVDANFLIFERIREELDQGKTIRTAIDEGFNHAWSAIVDTHVTTALTAIILYQFGTGPVKGFALTLLAGIGASLVSAIFVVRTLFLLWLNRKRATQTLSI
jgi:preprotein translocase subunit SecD